MKNYKTSEKTIDEFWSLLFLAMSTKWFDTFVDYLHFPLKVTNDLVSISRDFSVTYLQSLDIPVPRSFEREFNKKITEEMLTASWKHTFLQLQAIEQAEIVYKWGQRQLKQQKVYREKFTLQSDWDYFLIHWAENPDDKKFSTLNLPRNTIYELRLVVMSNFIIYQKAKIFVNQAEKSTKNKNDEWDHYLFNKQKIGSWIINSTWQNTQISKWQTIFELLSYEQLLNLQRWGEKNLEANYYSAEKVIPSIVELSKNLSRL